MQWVVIACLFVVLAISRWFSIEDRADDWLRDLARSRQLYDGRTVWQGPLTVMIVGLAMAGAALGVRQISATGRTAAHRFLVIARLAAFAMIALIIVRLISMHPVDSLLYGDFRLNWLIDMGITLAVGWAAWRWCGAYRSGLVGDGAGVDEGRDGAP